MSSNEIDRYLDELDEPKRTTLEHLRRTILELVPGAEQGMSYGVPAFRVDGKVIAGFSAAKSHLSYLPHSGSVLGTIQSSDLGDRTASKGALKFAIDEPLPHDLVAKLIAARLAEVAG